MHIKLSTQYFAPDKCSNNVSGFCDVLVIMRLIYYYLPFFSLWLKVDLQVYVQCGMLHIDNSH